MSLNSSKISKISEGVIKKNSNDKRISLLKPKFSCQYLLPNDLGSKSEIFKERINKLKVNEDTPSSGCSSNNLNIINDDFSKRSKEVRKVSSFNPVNNRNCDDSASVLNKPSNKFKTNYDSKTSNLKELSNAKNNYDESNSSKKDLSHKDKKKSSLNSSKESYKDIEREMNSARHSKK